MDGSEHAYVKLVQDESGYPPYEAEEIDVERVENGVYKVLHPPLWSRDFTHLDLVSAERHPDGTLWLTGVVQEGRGWNARIIPLKKQTAASVAALLPESDAQYVVAPANLVHVVGDGPASQELVDTIEEGRLAGDWDVDWAITPPVR